MKPTTGDRSEAAGFVHECGSCRQRDRCILALPLPLENDDCAAVVQRRGTIDAGKFLFRRNEPFAAVYLVCEGAVKTERVTPDGGQLVTGFYLGGDMVGLEALGGAQYPCDAVATARSTVCKLDFERLLRLCPAKPEMHSWIMSKIAFYARKKDEDLSWSLGLGTRRRVLRFFVELHDQLRASADTPAEVAALPLKKQDIARYLHIAPETLSRSLGELRRQNLLLIEQDHFVLPDPGLAEQLTQL
jgi:CRP/FNR family transcriptional regulator